MEMQTAVSKLAFNLSYLPFPSKQRNEREREDGIIPLDSSSSSHRRVYHLMTSIHAVSLLDVFSSGRIDIHVAVSFINPKVAT